VHPHPALRLQPSTPIDVTGLGALQAALWDRRDKLIPAQEVLYTYETRWDYIDADEMDAYEADLLKRLVEDLGNGVFLA